MTPKNNRAPFLYYIKLASFEIHQWIQTGVTFRKRPSWVKIDDFLARVWPRKLTYDFENNRAPLLYYFKLCASFRSQWWIQTGVTVRKRLIWVKIDDFFSRVTLKFDVWPWKTMWHLFYATSSFVHHFVGSHWWIQSGVTVRKRPIWVKINDFFSRVTLQFDVWPWKTTGHLFCATSSFVHHFVAIGEFKLELQSGHAPFGSKSTTFFSRVTLQFDAWPWKTIGHLFSATGSFVHHFVAIGEFKLELQSGNAQVESKLIIFFSPRVTLQIDVWLWKTIGHLFYITSSFVRHFVGICEFKLELQPGNA